MMRSLQLLLCVLILPGGELAADQFPQHVGSGYSFEFAGKPSDTFVVGDQSATSDRLLYRFQGPIEIDVPVRRYVGPTDENGYLLNRADLESRGLVGATATVRLVSYDVDARDGRYTDCDGDGFSEWVSREIDEVYLNGSFIGLLSGDDRSWQAQRFAVPIDLVRFPSSPGETAINRISVEIDTANLWVEMSGGYTGPCAAWEVEVDWASIEFDASPVIVLLHGIRSAPGALAELETGIQSQLLVTDDSIVLTDLPPPDPFPVGCGDAPYNASILYNLGQLREQIPLVAELYGTSTIALVGHSKGGLDGRVFSYTQEIEPLEVTVGAMSGELVRKYLRIDSLVTINTPHSGSVLADFGVAGRQNLFSSEIVQGQAIAFLPYLGSWFDGPYMCDLTVQIASAWVAATPLTIPAASVATDADADDSGTISAAEAAGFGPAPVISQLAGSFLYDLVGNVETFDIEVEPRPGLPDLVELTANPTSLFQANDFIVTVQSSSGYPVLESIADYHHTNVTSQEVGQQIALIAQDAGGILDWRVE